MRRTGPRHVSVALGKLTRQGAPATVLARAQSAWKDAVGAAIAAEAEPVSERAGTLTVACPSPMWAQEIAMRGPDIVGQLNEVLEPGGTGPLKDLRVDAARKPERPVHPPRRRIP